MLVLDIPERELYDEAANEFHSVKPITLRLEHSLVSISKWESKWKKPFIDKVGHTEEELIDYVRCMTLNQNVDPFVYSVLNTDDLKKIEEYIGDSMTATTFSNVGSQSSAREKVTSELIYFWMVSYNVPFECQKWHLSRLITLLRICSVKNSPQKKMSKRAILQQNAALNAARRKKYKTKG